jgi:hypothetical protein
VWRREEGNELCGGDVGAWRCVGVMVWQWRLMDPSDLRKKKEIPYLLRASPTMRRATPPGTVGVAGSHCVCGQRGG